MRKRLFVKIYLFLTILVMLAYRFSPEKGLYESGKCHCLDNTYSMKRELKKRRLASLYKKISF
jgi:hypothetical protein